MKLVHVKKQARITWDDYTTKFNDDAVPIFTNVIIDHIGDVNNRPFLFCRVRVEMIICQIEGTFQ